MKTKRNPERETGASWQNVGLLAPVGTFACLRQHKRASAHRTSDSGLFPHIKRLSKMFFERPGARTHARRAWPPC